MKTSALTYTSITSTLLMGLYWTGNAFILTYASIFLLDKGLNNTQIGLILSAGAILSILLQAVPSALSDRFTGLTLRLIMIFFVLLELGIVAGIHFYSGNKLMLMLEYALLEGLDWAFLAFVNAISMEYENHGYPVNFSVVRSCGSLFYGVSTLFLGLLSNRFSLGFLMPCLLMVRIGTLISVCLMKNVRTDMRRNSSKNTKKDTGAGASGYRELFCTHPKLPLLLFGFFCLWISGTSTNNYIIHIIHKVGGNNANMGFISSTSAWMEIPFMLLCGLLLRRHSSQSLLRLSAFFYISKPAIMLLAHSIPIVALGQYMQGPSYAMSVFLPAVYHLWVQRYFLFHQDSQQRQNLRTV